MYQNSNIEYRIANTFYNRKNECIKSVLNLLGFCKKSDETYSQYLVFSKNSYSGSDKPVQTAELISFSIINWKSWFLKQMNQHTEFLEPCTHSNSHSLTHTNKQMQHYFDMFSMKILN